MWLFGGRDNGSRQSPATYNKFTACARSALALAVEEARRFRYTYVDTEHLLLGLLRETDGVAARLLVMQGLDLEAARMRVIGLMRQVIGPDDRIQHSPADESSVGHLAPPARDAITFTAQEAIRLKRHYIGTEHMLLGLLREEKGIAAQALTSLGVTLASAREGVIMATNLAMTPRTSPDDEPSTAFIEAARGVGVQQDERARTVTSVLDASALDAADTLVWAGLYPTRGAAVAWLVSAGVEAQQQLITDLRQRRADAASAIQQSLPSTPPDEQAPA